MKIELASISKIFGTVVALDRVSAAFQSGEVVALVGPNGAGKSTLIRILSLLLTPSAGTCLVNDSPIKDSKEFFLSRLGIVTQDAFLYDDLTVHENLNFYASLYKVNVRVTELMTCWNLLELRERLPKQLSRGQKQRVALARAAIHEPQLLLLDEPFVALDSDSIGYVRELITQVTSRQGIAIVATHTPACLNDLMTRSLHLEDGHIRRDVAGSRWKNIQ